MAVSTSQELARISVGGEDASRLNRAMTVLGMCDKPVLFSLPPATTVAQLREEVWKSCNIPFFEQHFFIGGLELNDDDFVFQSPQTSSIDFQRTPYISDPSLVQEMLRQTAAGDLNGLEQSLRIPLDPQCTISDGCTAMHIAAREGHLEVMQLLLWPGLADRNARMKGGRTPIHCAALAGQAAACRFLCDKVADWKLPMDDGQGVLHLAARGGHVEVLGAMNRLGFDVNLEMELEWTAMHVAAISGHLAFAQALKSMAALMDPTAKDGRRPLHLAAESGNMPFCKYLYECNADLKLPAKNGWTPLHSAVLSGNTDLCKWLIEEESAGDVERWPLELAAEGGAALHMAAALGHLEIVRLWCVPGVNTDVQMVDGLTPLHGAVVIGHLEVAKMLCLAKGGSKDFCRIDGATPIYLATENRQIEMVKMLIGLKVDVSKRTAFELMSPLMRAVQIDYMECLQLLLKAQCELDQVSYDGGTALYFAAENNRVDMARLLCRAGAGIEVYGFLERRPLHAAAELGFIDVVRVLVKEKAELDAEMRGKWTPLHLAAHKGHFEVVKLLCERGANKETEIEVGETPLFVAANARQVDIAQFLISDCANLEGPMQSATDGNHLEVAHFLNRLRHLHQLLELPSARANYVELSSTPERVLQGTLAKTYGDVRGPAWFMSPQSSEYACKVNKYLAKGLRED